MALIGKKTKTEAVGEGSSWTAGRNLSGRAIAIGLFAAIACGPIALFAFASQPETVVAAPETRSGTLPSSQQAAGDYALGYVAAWLGASRDDTVELEQYIDAATVREISTTPWEYRDLAIASLSPAEGSSLITVVIGANVRELTTDDEGGNGEAWPRRYFQVVVNVSDVGELGVVGLPAPIAPPAPTEDTVKLEYPAGLDNSTPVAESVLAFLNAYLAGSGDITRVSTPGTDFEALDPAPYVSIDLVDLIASIEPAANPGDGDTVRVLASVTLANVYDQRLSATYALTLTARDSRWEISAIDLAPQQTTAAGEDTAPSSTPSPTGDGSN